jgi:hypothetical protein
LSEEDEFTTESLIKKIQKLSDDNQYYFYGRQEKVISKHLSELLKDGYLSVRYTSMDMKPGEHYHQKLANSNRYLYKDKWRTRWGSKTIAVYKMTEKI